MDLVTIYGCLCDRTRLRILGLLLGGPLCVCHIQEALQEPQVKVSKHLAYLRGRGMVSVRRRGSRMIYSLPARRSRQLEANLSCLQDCVGEDRVFRSDATRLRRIRGLPGRTAGAVHASPPGSGSCLKRGRPTINPQP